MKSDKEMMKKANHLKFLNLTPYVNKRMYVFTLIFYGFLLMKSPED